MTQKYKLLLIVIIFAAVLIAGSVFYALLSDGDVPETVGDQPPATALAPDFSVQDTAGKTINLRDLRGKPTVINFWTTWCGYCKMEMPDFEKAYRQYGDRVNFMMVDLTDGVRETPAKGSAFIADAGYTFPVYFDWQGQALQRYQAYSIPLTVLVDADGKLVRQHRGMMNGVTLENYIENLLGGK